MFEHRVVHKQFVPGYYRPKVKGQFCKCVIGPAPLCTGYSGEERGCAVNRSHGREDCWTDLINPNA